MRAAPPLLASVERFDFWNALLAILGGLVVLVGCVWWGGDHAETPMWVEWLVGFSAAASVLGLGASLRRRPVFLRWDSQHWYCSQPYPTDREDGPWRLSVPIDLGDFMLLRLESLDDSRPATSRWLPVQRLTWPADWHALRCAVESSRAECAFAPVAARHTPID